MKLDIDRLDRLMQLTGLSAKELASRAGISPPLLSRIRSRGSCSPTTARKLVRAIGEDIIDHGFQPSAEQVAQMQSAYEKAVAEIHQAQAAQIHEQIAKELTEFDALILDFITQPVPRNWSLWPISSRIMFWKGEQDRVELTERDRVCAAEVWCEVLQSPLEHMRYRDAMQINTVISRAPGWIKSKKSMRFGPYGVRRGFVRSNKLKNR